MAAKKKTTKKPAVRADQWNLRLYIAGDSPRSRSALQNLQRLCELRLRGKYTIEIIDLTKRPELAKADQILAVPTLIRKIPEPMKRIIGDLSDSDRALIALEMQDRPTPVP
jgi:circadian clock protein KaiB